MALSEKRKRRRRPPAAQITPETPIWCPACQEEHPARAFNKESRRFSGLHGVCRDAQARARQTPEGKAKTAERNKRRWADEQYRQKAKEWQRRNRQRHGATALLKKSRSRLQAIVIEWKTQGCIDCGFADVRAIDPDHINPVQKHDNISRMVTMCASAQRIRQELEKCVPRCIRCHRRVTSEARPSKLRGRDRVPPSWQRRINYQDRVDKFKLALGCMDCGWSGWPRGLDLDHVRGEKVAAVSTLIGRSRPWIELIDELLKCECVCANCHRLRTLARDQYRSNSGNDTGHREVVRGHGLAEPPRNRNRALASVLLILRFSEEEVGGPTSKVGDVRLAHKQEDVTA
jgi:hypothetical protein